MLGTSEPVLHVGGDIAWPDALPAARRVERATPDALKRARSAVLALPGLQGWDELDRWRRGGHRLPVVVVCAEGPLDQRRSHLEPVEQVPPSAPAEALMRALERLQRRAPPATLQLSTGRVDLDQARFVDDGGSELRLTRREVDLLAHLAARPFQDVERDDLLRQVWGQPKPGLTKAVDMAVSRLRKKIERDPREPEHLVATRGGGYRLVLPRAPAPASAPAWVGREPELDRLRQALAGRVPVVSVFGPPGVGKTRLVREALRGHDVVEVELSVAATDDGLWRALRTALALPARPSESDPAEQIVAALRHRGPVRLVLHGVGGVLDPLAALARRLPASACLCLTSRERPGLAGELGITVGPLPREEARALLQRRALEAGIALPDDPAALDPVLALLDGLPLAIELAAPHLRGRTPAELAATLTTGWSTLSRRGTELHDSLERTLGAAWQLLSPEQRAHLAALSVLPGPFDRSLAAAVAGPAGEAALDALFDTSWLGSAPDGFRWLGQVRRFVGQRADADDLARGRTALGQVVARRAVALRQALRGSGLAHDDVVSAHGLLQAAWLELEAAAVADVALALDDLLGELGRADDCAPLLQQALERCRPEDVFRLQVALGRALCAGPQAARGMAMLHETTRGVTAAQQAEARVSLSEALALHGDYAEAEVTARLAVGGLPRPEHRGLWARAVSIAMVAATFTRGPEAVIGELPALYAVLDDLVEAGQHRLAFKCQNRALVVLYAAGDTGGLRGGLDRLLGMARHLTAPSDLITATWQRSNFCLHTGAHVQAIGLLEAQRAQLLASGLEVNAAIVALNLAQCHAELGDAVSAHAALDAVARGSRPALVQAARLRALLALEAGDVGGARSMLDRVLADASGDRRVEALVRGDLGLCHLADGQPEAALAALGSVDADVLSQTQRVHLAARAAAADPGLAETLAALLHATEDPEVEPYRAWARGDPLPDRAPAALSVRLLARAVRAPRGA